MEGSLRPGAGAGGRLGKDKISPAAQGGLHAGGLGQEGGSAPLSRFFYIDVFEWYSLVFEYLSHFL